MIRLSEIKSVMVVARHLIYGGTERYTLNLVNSLVNKGISVVLVTGDGPLVSRVDPRVKVYILPISRKFRLKQINERKILRIASEHNPQIIHTQCRTSMISSQLARSSLNIPLITHEHHMYNLQDYPFITDELREGADHIITIGPYTRKTLIKYGFNPSKITAILNGVNLAEFPLITTTERELYRELLGLTESEKVIVCISRVVKGKGLDKLIVGFKSVINKIKNTKLLIIGDDEEFDQTKANLLALIREYKLGKKVLLFPGEYNIRKYQAVADVFCYPALSKGMSVIEAMSVGLPVVGKKTTRKPLIVEDGISGLMTKPSKQYKIDPSEIAQKLSYLLSHPKTAKRMGLAGRRKIEERFSQERHLKKLLKVYIEVAHSHQSRTVMEPHQLEYLSPS